MFDGLKLTRVNYFILGIILLISLVSSVLISRLQANALLRSTHMEIEDRFDLYSTAVKAYSELIVTEGKIDTNLVQEIIGNPNLPVFQFRLIREDGLEIFKIDNYGFNNKNNVSDRIYWQEIRTLPMGSWHVTKAQSNWENDPLSGEEIITNHMTFRYFLRTSQSLNGINNPFMVFNIDFGLTQDRIKTLYHGTELEELSNEQKTGWHLTPTAWELTTPLQVSIDSRSFPILFVSSRFSILPFLGTALLAFLLLGLYYLMHLKNLQRLQNETQGRKEHEYFVENWINMASHYFRHPVTNISTNIDILILKKILDKETKQTKAIQNSLDEFLRIFEHLQKMNVLNSIYKRGLHSESVHAIVDGIQLKNKTLVIKELPLNDPFIQVDKETFNWAIREIIENAVHHGHAHEIYLEVKDGTKEVEFIITDNGIGMDELVVKAINSNNLARKLSGFESGNFGLGYFQILRILKHNRCNIQVDSDVSGTKVRIGVPKS